MLGLCAWCDLIAVCASVCEGGVRAFGGAYVCAQTGRTRCMLPLRLASHLDCWCCWGRTDCAGQGLRCTQPGLCVCTPCRLLSLVCCVPGHTQRSGNKLLLLPWCYSSSSSSSQCLSLCMCTNVCVPCLPTMQGGSAGTGLAFLPCRVSLFLLCACDNNQGTCVPRYGLLVRVGHKCVRLKTCSHCVVLLVCECVHLCEWNA